MLKAFHLENPALPGPPEALPQWLKAFEDGVDDYDELDSDASSTKSSRANFFRKGGVM
jgi:hypothetical protein